MSERGVIYMVWGRNDRTEKALERSRKSISAVHPELPVEVLGARPLNKGVCRRHKCSSSHHFVKRYIVP